MREVKLPPAIDIVGLARETIDLEIQALKAIVPRLGAGFEQAVRTILAASGKVIATGIGKSGIVARKIAATLSSTGTPAVFLHPVDALHGDWGTVQQGDVVILISKSGETPELLTLCDAVASADCKTIGIVGRRASTLMRRCQVALDASVDREACPLNLAPTSSALTAIALGDAIAACLVRLRGFTPADFSRLHPLGSLGKRLLLRVRDVMHRGEELPLVEPGSLMRAVLVTLTSKGMGAVIVTNAEGDLLGIFTDGDLRRSIEKHEALLCMKIDEVMTRNPVAIRSDRMAVEAVRLMEDRPSQISVLPVLDGGGKVVGIVRIHDLVRHGL